ncbi:hypothetical protein HBA55_09110 [Pseudomaricurvus alkylphenolicus]|uniref:hypothetical protein n=1 Tax=Pseudomaricurvus alkylphenolicus TaxID=1306991 RepID=UPI00141D8997|nr:hypothetical protein [Pseudomaricurvus alkylphenolicus]NIB39741.1 hypothetical protein [Pseudomaricurvus alkylphenolicus]
MKYLVTTMCMLFISMTVYAHNGEDPARDLEKKRSYILQYQKDFQVASSKTEKIKSIKRQVSTLRSTVLLLRNSLAKENSSVRASLSKHDLDYLAAMKNSLRDMQELLDQLEETVEG